MAALGQWPAIIVSVQVPVNSNVSNALHQKGITGALIGVDASVSE